MQRLTAITLSRAGPVGSAHLAFGDITILTGVNDSGKTQVLKAIERSLIAPGGAETGRIFGLARVDEIEQLFPDGLPEIPERLDGIGEEVADAVRWPIEDGWLRLAVDTPEWPDGLLTSCWGYARRELPADVRELLQELDDGRVQLSDDDSEPTAVEYLGYAHADLLPIPISVPTAPEQVAEELGVALVHLTRVYRMMSGVGEAVEPLLDQIPDGPDPNWSDVQDRTEDDTQTPSAVWLLELTHDSATLHPAAKRAAVVIERALARLLPEFITDKYRVHVRPAEPLLLAHGQLVDIELALRDPTGGEEWDDEEWEEYGVRVPLAEVPSGFVLWLQLTLLELSARVINVAMIMCTLQRMLKTLYFEQRDLELGDARSSPDRQMLEETFKTGFAYINQPGAQPFEELIEPLNEIVAQFPRPDRDDGAYDRTRYFIPARVYLIDEPEQRLHPALQRRAARWLVHAMDSWRAQALLATHALAFIDLPGNTTVYELTRDHGESYAHPIDVAQLTPQAQLIRELGLDRGELLGRHHAFLFTETAELAADISQRHSAHLSAAHINVRPLITTASNHGLGQLELLLEATGLTVAVLLTSITASDIERVRASSTEERQQLIASDPRLATLARLVAIELGHERCLRLIPTPGDPDRVEDLLWQLEQEIIAPTS